MSGNRSIYLLAISIGPIQDFIAASRKARDLAYGSEILSRLSRKAAMSLQSQGAEIIFPSSLSLLEKHSVANKLLAVATTSDIEMVAQSAREQAVQLLREEWTRLKDARLDKGAERQAIDVNLGDAQIEEFIEWYAAWVSFDPKDRWSYREARVQVERLLAGRKALRDFLPAHGVDARRKSSLDPSRESVIESGYEKSPDVQERLHLKASEGLDAISLIKRLNAIGAGNSRYVSTSRVAIDPFVRAAVDVDEAALAKVEGYARRLSQIDISEPFAATEKNGLAHYAPFQFDCQLFYEQTHEQARNLVFRESRGDTVLSQVAVEFVTETRKLQELLGGHWKELPAYYAILLADGDRMGKAIGAIETPEGHRAFSTELGSFAVRAGEIVRDHFGALIYSGGDDVLAFLPLDTAIPCANVLQAEFADILHEALLGYDVEEPPTLSVGLAIGHYAEHLQVMLGRARSAEGKAKGPRNALAVSFSAHSGGGEERTVVTTWEDDAAIRRWATAVELHRHDRLPDGAAFELDQLRREFAQAEAENAFAGVEDAARVMVIEEAARILERKRPRRGQKAIAAKIVRDVRKRLEGAGSLKATIGELDDFVGELIISRRIYRLLLDDESAGAQTWRVSHQLLKPSATRSGAPTPGAGEEI